MTTDIKFFSIAEANRTLPLVKNIVRDILDNATEMRLIAEELAGNLDEDSRIKKLASEIDGFMLELEEIGCYFKDPNFKIGLVDFPSMIDGEDVLLCWRSDEDEIRYYHNLESGYSSRKLIPPEYFA
jgi:hypothetical protein